MHALENIVLETDAFDLGQLLRHRQHMAGFGPVMAIFLERLGRRVGLQNYVFQGNGFGGLLKVRQAQQRPGQGDKKSRIRWPRAR